jgi:YbbR domain-containing protein
VTRRFGWIFENFGWKVLALVSAVFLWAIVATEPELSSFVTVPVAYKNLPENLEISGGPVNTVQLELRGPAGELRTLGDATGVRPAVVIDMTGVQPGERTFPIGDGNVKLARNVRLVRAVPSEARFEFEPRARRTVDVQPRVSEDASSGYTVESVSVAPQQLEIVGPASRIARIASVVTDRVDVSGVFGIAEFRVNAFVEDPYVRFAGSPQVAVTVTMKKK